MSPWNLSLSLTGVWGAPVAFGAQYLSASCLLIGADPHVVKREDRHGSLLAGTLSAPSRALGRSWVFRGRLNYSGLPQELASGSEIPKSEVLNYNLGRPLMGRGTPHTHAPASFSLSLPA